MSMQSSYSMCAGDRPSSTGDTEVMRTTNERTTTISGGLCGSNQSGSGGYLSHSSLLATNLPIGGGAAPMPMQYQLLHNTTAQDYLQQDEGQRLSAALTGAMHQGGFGLTAYCSITAPPPKPAIAPLGHGMVAPPEGGTTTPRRQEVTSTSSTSVGRAAAAAADPFIKEVHRSRRQVATTTTATASRAGATAVPAAPKAADKRKRKSGWRKPSDKPKRPLSAYNIFFQHEREKIVAAAADGADAPIPSVSAETRGVPPDAIATAVYSGVPSADKGSVGTTGSTATIPRAVTANSKGSSPAVAETVSTLQKIILRSRGQTKASADKVKSNRAHTKTHGKISFVDLAKTVAKNWKELDPASKAVYVALADIERSLYRKKVEEWERKKKAEGAANGATATATTKSKAKTKTKVAVDPAAVAARQRVEKKAADDDRERMRRILSNSSRHGSVHNTSEDSSGDDDGGVDVSNSAPGLSKNAATGATDAAGTSISQIASFVYGMHQ
mmetsp:Transcript_33042/g.72460  ORF Transcript_33042/g.72460 Transcript_33042/m.72460 type:complete len:500 (-) Transcript_33042:1064-2563(-)